MKKVKSNLQEIKLSYHTPKASYKAESITTSLEAFSYLTEFYPKNEIGMQERFVILYLNRNNRPIGAAPMFKGGVSATIIDNKLIFATALKSLASGIILSHNHPSGSSKPSEEDRRVTQKIKDGCRLLEITLIDHLILTPDGNYLSFADEGII
jgi:DNA repair protein RadC